MHCSHLLIAFQEIQNFSNRSKFICSEDCFDASNTSEAAPSYPPLPSPELQIPVGSDRKLEGTEHRDSTGLRGSVKEAARISTGHDPGQTTRGRAGLGLRLRPARCFYCLICLENRTFNSVGIPGPAAATSYLLEDSDNPPGCAWEGTGQKGCFSGTCHSVPSIASNGSSQRQSQTDEGICQRFQSWGKLSFYLNLFPKTWYFLVVIPPDSGPSALCQQLLLQMTAGLYF